MAGLEYAELEPNPPNTISAGNGKPSRYTDAQLIEMLQKKALELGKPQPWLKLMLTHHSRAPKSG